MNPTAYVWELSRALLGDRNGLICVIRVYIDESGVHDSSPVVTVGAYLSTPKKWRDFSKKWKWAIRPIEIYHATDAANLHGEFEGWNNDQVANLFKKAVPFIPKFTEMAVVYGINIRDMREAVKGISGFEWNIEQVYHNCLYWTVGEIMREKLNYFNADPIAFFHENNAYQATANKVFSDIEREYNILKAPVSFAFGAKKDYVPLQAADILAYECNKRLRDYTQPDRKSFQALTPYTGRFTFKYYDKRNLDFLVDVVKRGIAQEGVISLAS